MYGGVLDLSRHWSFHASRVEAPLIQQQCCQIGPEGAGKLAKSDHTAQQVREWRDFKDQHLMTGCKFQKKNHLYQGK